MRHKMCTYVSLNFGYCALINNYLAFNLLFCRTMALFFAKQLDYSFIIVYSTSLHMYVKYLVKCALIKLRIGFLQYFIPF